MILIKFFHVVAIMTFRGIAALLVLLGLTGCLTPVGAAKALSGRIEVFGVEFGAAVDYRQLAGVSGTDEPCLHGFERSFDALAVVVGYGADRRVRKIVTRNLDTRILGVRPGLQVADGELLLQQAGLVPGEKRYCWLGAGFVVTLLVDEAGVVFGVAVEADD